MSCVRIYCSMQIYNDTLSCVNMQVSYIIALFNEASEWVNNKWDLKAKGVVCVWFWLVFLDCFAGQMFSFLHFSFSPPSFTAISRIPLSPIFRSQACNYVGLLVCVCFWKEEGGTGGVVEPATSSWCINYPLGVSVTHTRTHTHTHTHTHTRVHKHSHGCLQTRGLRYTHI